MDSGGLPLASEVSARAAATIGSSTQWSLTALEPSQIWYDPSVPGGPLTPSIDLERLRERRAGRHASGGRCWAMKAAVLPSSNPSQNIHEPRPSESRAARVPTKRSRTARSASLTSGNTASRRRRSETSRSAIGCTRSGSQAA